jgi:hypothetical protein
MSTIKSSAENLTLNADGANNDVIIQSNGSTKVTVDGATGNVGIGGSPTNKLHIRNDGTTQRGDLRLGDAGGTTYWDIGRDNASTGDFTIFNQTDEKLRILSSGGLTFNGDTAAANALDDYEEGNWTPTVNGGSWTLAIQKATYTKVGNLVTLLIYIDIGTNSGDGTRFEIGGMPFATLGNGYGQGSADTNTLGHVGLRTQSAASYMIVKKANNNTWVNENEIDGGHLIGALIYHVA